MFLMRFLCFFLLLPLFVDGFEEFADNDFASPMDVVVHMLSKFETLSAGSADVLAHVSKVSKETMAFLKLGFPVGSLIAGSLQIATETESPEYIALQRLNNTMLTEFKKIDAAIGFAVNEIALGAALLDYTNNVEVPFEELKRQCRLFWNPAIDKSEWDVQNFQKVCALEERTTNPLKILDYLYVHAVKKCPMPFVDAEDEDNGTERTRLVSRFYAFLRRMQAERVSQTTPTALLARVEGQAAAILSMLTYALKSEDGSQIWQLFTNLEEHFFDKLERNYTTMELALEAVNQYLTVQNTLEPVPRTEICILNDIVEGKRYHHRPIEQLSNMIRQDTLQLLLFGSICANISFGGNPAKMNWYQHEISHRVHLILTHVKHWVPKKLYTSWPSVDIEQVKAAIDAMHLATVVEEETRLLDKIATNISETLKPTGNPKLFRQFVIVPASRQIGIDFKLIGPSKYGINITNYNSLHIVMTRFFVDDEDRIFLAHQWLREKRPTILSTIKKNYNAERVDKLLEQIAEEMNGTLTNHEFFRNAAMVRKSTFFSYECKKPASGWLPYITESLFGIKSVHYFFAGQSWFPPRDCEDYELHFFV